MKILIKKKILIKSSRKHGIKKLPIKKMKITVIMNKRKEKRKTKIKLKKIKKI
jgi:hypothetical protein